MTTTVGLGETVNYKFTTSVNGVPTQLAGSPAVACYVGSSTTERTTGVTLTVDFDARTGLNNVAIVATSGNGYAAGERITLVITAGTVGGYSVVGTVVGAFCVVPAMVYDALVDGTDTLQADVTQWLGTAAATPSVAGVPEVDLTHIAGSAVNTSSAQLGVNVVQAAGTAWGSGAITSGAFASGAITATAIAANAIGASELAADAVAEIADAVWDEARSGHISAGTFGEGVASVQGNVTGSVASVTGAVGSVTGNVGGNVSGSVGSVATGGIAAGSIADGALTAAKFASGAFDAVWSVSTRTLTSISGLGIALATKLTKYVQLLARKDSAIATDNATELTEINADGGSGAGAFANTTDAVEALRDNQQTAAAAALTAYDPPTNAEMEARTLAAAAYATAAAQATAQADLDVLAGSDGVTLATSQPHYAPATAASATAIETDTQDIQSRLPAALVGGRMSSDAVAISGSTAAADAVEANIANLDAAVSSRATQAQILSDATPFAGANLDAAVSTRATPTQVNAEVVDALSVDTYAEPTGVPPATTTLERKIGQVYMALRNRVDVDSNTGKKQFFDDGGAAEWEKDFTDAGNVYSESEGNAP